MTVQKRSSKSTALVTKPGPRKTPRIALKANVSSANGAIERIALDSSLGYSLRRAQLSTYAEFSAAMTSYEVRPSHYAVLLLIRINPGMSQSAASSALGIQKANFVTLLDGLEVRGWTERRAVRGDRRSSALHLTAAGESFVAKLEHAHAAMERKLTMRLGERKSAMLLKLLHAFADAAEANVPPVKQPK